MRLRTTAALATTILTATALLGACGSDGGGETASGASVGAVDKEAPLYDTLPDSVTAKGKIVMGSQLSSPPVVYLEEDATTASGVNVDLAEKLSEQLGVPITFHQASFASLTPALESGKIDAIFDMMGDTAERQATFDFVDYMLNGLTYLVAEGNPEKITAVEDLCGRSISGVSGTSLVTYAQKASTDCQAAGQQPIEVKQFNSASDARLQVQNGKSVAFLGQTPIMLYLADTAEDGNAFDAVVDEAYPTETIGIAVDKDQSELRDALQQAMQALIEDGSYSAVLDEYGLGDLGVDRATVNAGS